MIPLRDDLSGGGPPAAALLLVFAALVGGLVAEGSSFWAAALCALGMYLFSPSVVRSKGALVALLIAVAGGLAAFGLASLIGTSAQAWITPGATASVTCAHLLIHRRARIVGLVLLPAASRVVSAPAIAIAALLLVATSALVASGA